MDYTINKISKIAGVTLRTLRYYDKIGLLTPSKRTEAGYRIYTDEDIEKLQQILFFKELDFPLSEIVKIMNSPNFDRGKALKIQIKYLENKAKRYKDLSTLAKETLGNLRGGIKMENKDMFKGFDYDKMMEEQKQYEKEVKERWGNTDAYKQSMEKTSKYTKEDWERISETQNNNLKTLCELYNSGVSYDDERVQETVDRARQFITDYFYNCTLEIFSNLGQMYVQDERFTAFYEKYAIGLAEYYNNAIQHYCITKS